MVPGRPRVAWTMMGPSRLGSRWRTTMRSGDAPQPAHRQDELPLPQGQHLGPGQPRVGDPAGGAESQDQAAQRRPEHGGDEDRQEEAGEGQEHVDEAHRQLVPARPPHSPPRCRTASPTGPRARPPSGPPRARRGRRRRPGTTHRCRCRPSRANGATQGPATRRAGRIRSGGNRASSGANAASNAIRAMSASPNHPPAESRRPSLEGAADGIAIEPSVMSFGSFGSFGSLGPRGRAGRPTRRSNPSGGSRPGRSA